MPTKRQTTTRAPRVSPTKSVSNWFHQWLVTKDEAEQLSERQGDLRVRLLDTITENGFEDDKGNWWFDLDEPVQFADRKGKVFKFTSLKRERHLSPAQPTPDPDKAESLLRKKNLWLTSAQEKLIKDLQLQCPYAVVNVSVDLDAVASLEFKGIISEKEYDATLREQKESFQFRPTES
jgi:hypothetical protein